MYSRNIAGRGSAEKVNLPPKYDGSRFAHPSADAASSRDKESEKAAAEVSRVSRRVADRAKVEPAASKKNGAHYDFSQEVFSFDRDAVTSPSKELLFDDFADTTVGSSAAAPSSSAVASVGDDAVSGVPEVANDEKSEKDDKNNILSAVSALFGKNKFSHEDLLIAALMVLMSGSEGNEDMLIILALLLAYRS